MFYFGTATLILRKRGNDLPVGGNKVRCVEGPFGCWVGDILNGRYFY